MSYSACDFTDDIAAALGVALDPYEDDEGDLQKLVGYALEEIDRLQRIVAALAGPQALCRIVRIRKGVNHANES